MMRFFCISGCGIVLVSAAFLGGVAPADAAVITSWGSAGSGNGQFNRPESIALDSAGNVYVLDWGNTRIEKFDSGGAFLSAWSISSSLTQLGNVGGLAVDSANNVYVSGQSTVEKYDSQGQFLTSWSSGSRIRDVAVDSASAYGALYDTGRVQKYDLQGSAGIDWDITPGASGQFGTPTPLGLATDSGGSVYVSDDDRRIQKFDSQGALITRWGTAGAADGQLSASDGIHAATLGLGTDPSTAVYVADSGNNRVQKFDSDGHFLGKFGTAGSALGQLSSPSDVAADGTGQVFVSDRDNNRIVKIDTTLPSASVTASPVVMTGQSVELDATQSSVLLGSISRYQWDLDGDGSFETDTGSDPRVTTSYVTRGEKKPVVLVTAPSGKFASASATVDVRQAPSAGQRGASINNGAQFTNTPQVSVTLRWPLFATDFVLSNDGGFVNPLAAQVESTVPWTLNSSGPERLPKTIYVRFNGGQSGAETYQDDIILDQTPPELSDVALKGVGDIRSARRAVARRFTVTSSASDATSGVAEMQLALDRRLPKPFVPYARTLRVALASPPRWGRVRDFAGNVSPWRSVVGSSAPALRISTPKGRRIRLRRGVLDVRASADQSCEIVTRLLLPSATAHRLGLPTRLLRRTARLKPGRPRSLRLQIPARTRAKLGRASRARATLRVVATNTVGLSASKRTQVLLIR